MHHLALGMPHVTVYPGTEHKPVYQVGGKSFVSFFSPFFTTPHLDGHLSILLRASRIGEITYDELAEVVQEAWLSRASAARRSAWLKEHLAD